MSHNQFPNEDLFELEDVLDELDLSENLKEELKGYLGKSQSLSRKSKNDKRRKDRFSD